MTGKWSNVIYSIDSFISIICHSDITLLTLNNLEAVLRASHSQKENVLKVTIFISDISLWADANAIYGEFFGDHKPARSAVPTKDLPKGFLIEIEAIAFEN